MKKLYYTFDRGWYYHRDNDDRKYYEDYDFCHTNEIVLMSNEIGLICEDFYKNFLNVTEPPPCYLVLKYLDDKWVCFIDFYTGSVDAINKKYKPNTLYELRHHNNYLIDIGDDYNLDEWKLVQTKALELLTNFIMTHGGYF